jgi:hypothetical protein
VQLPQRRPRLDALLLDEGTASIVERLQRLGVPAGAVQCEHEQLAQGLVPGVLPHQAGQLHGRLGVLAQLQRGAGAQLLGAQPQLGQPLPVQLGERARHAEVGGALPQPQRTVQRGACPDPVTGGEPLLPGGPRPVEGVGVQGGLGQPE